MDNHMELDNYFGSMVLILVELFQMDLFKVKEDLFQAVDHIIKVKYGIMLLKEKENIVMIKKNIHIQDNG